MNDWFQEKNFWRAVQPLLFSKATWESAATDVGQGLALLSPPEGGKVLDLACGPGRHALQFARRGFRVTAVDLMESHLEEGRRRARDQGLDIEFVHSDMRDFARPDAFHVVWNYFTSFGYFDDPLDNRTVLANAFLSLGPGGELFLETADPGHIKRFWQDKERHVHPAVEGIELVEEGRLSEDGTKVAMVWSLIRDGEPLPDRYRVALRIYTAERMEAMLAEVGFTRIRFYGNAAGEPYRHDSERMVVVARAPD